MKKLADILNKRDYVTHPTDGKFVWYKKHVPLFGVELELENPPDWKDVELNKIHQSYQIVHDGSLRNGCEYVSAIIHNKTLERFFTNTEFIFSKPHTASIRCSTHVHINARNLSLPQIRNWTTVYAVVEDALFSFCDPLRKGNNYCYSITHTKPTKSTLKQKQSQQDSLKYCAVNSGSLVDKGTLEFRQLEGTTDINKLKQWLCLLFDVYNYGINVERSELKRTLDELSSTSPYEAFLDSVFGEHRRWLRLTDHRSAMEDNITWAKLYLY